MQWIPDTVDALTRMLQEAGVIGSVGFLLALTIAFLLWKHLGQILEIARTGVMTKIKADAEIVSHLKDIAESNNQIRERVGKLPSDKVDCKAKNIEELAERFDAILAKNGIMLSDTELEILANHRRDMVAQSQAGEEIPK